MPPKRNGLTELLRWALGSTVLACPNLTAFASLRLALALFFASGEAKGLSKLHYIFSKQKLMKRVWFVRSSVVMTAPPQLCWWHGIGKHVPSETFSSSMEMFPKFAGAPGVARQAHRNENKTCIRPTTWRPKVTNSLVLEPSSRKSLSEIDRNGAWRCFLLCLNTALRSLPPSVKLRNIWKLTFKDISIARKTQATLGSEKDTPFGPPNKVHSLEKDCEIICS